MKQVTQIFAAMALVLFMSASVNAQVASTVADKSEAKCSEMKKCDPGMCDAMVKAGLCTKAQAEACKAKCSAKSTKVAAATLERGVATPVSSTEPTQKASCAKKCAKVCSGKNQ